MIRVSRRTPPHDDAAKARSIVEQGGSAYFIGDSRHLRRLSTLLQRDAGIEIFFGDVEISSDSTGASRREAMLMVEPVGESGSLVMDRVPRSA